MKTRCGDQSKRLGVLWCACRYCKWKSDGIIVEVRYRKKRRSLILDEIIKRGPQIRPTPRTATTTPGRERILGIQKLCLLDLIMELLMLISPFLFLTGNYSHTYATMCSSSKVPCTRLPSPRTTHMLRCNKLFFLISPPFLISFLMTAVEMLI